MFSPDIGGSQAILRLTPARERHAGQGVLSLKE